MIEEWRVVPGWEFYEVSNLGRVRRKEVGRRTFPGKILTPLVQKGYKTVKLLRGTKESQRRIKVHHMVLEAFVGPRPAGMECLHGDGDGTNNRVDNLRWGTRRENVADAQRHETFQWGEKNGNAKLTALKVRCIREFRKQGASGPLIARVVRTPLRTIYGIFYGRSWFRLPHD